MTEPQTTNPQDAAAQNSPVDDLETIVMLLETDSKVWAIDERRMQLLADLHGRIITSEAFVKKPQSKPSAPANGVAVVPLQGTITPTPSLLSLLTGGGGGLQSFMSSMRSAMADPEVNSIVMDVNSPGGMVDGIPEAAKELRRMRDSGSKPIVAVANTQAASAAYWLASQAHEVNVTDSGELGSIGVYTIHRDMSQAMKQMGVRPTIIKAGKYKAEGNPFEPLNDEAVASMQQDVNDFYDMFVKDVALGRGVDPQTVADGYGLGRSVIAKRAVTAGLADRVATLGQTVSRLATSSAKVKQLAEDESGRWSITEEAETPVSRTIDRDERDRLIDMLASAR